MKSEYLSFDIKGLPPMKRAGHNTRKGSPKNHIYKVNINEYTYYVFRIHRGGKSFTKYFKKKSEAKQFGEILKQKKMWI